MSRFSPILSGREARRKEQFGEKARRRGAGWTRQFRKGRRQRLPITPPKEES